MKYSIAKIEKEDALLKAMVTDLSGTFRELIFPSKYIKELCKTGMAYDGSSFNGINTINNSDSIILGDEETIVCCPKKISETEKTEYWIICDIVNRKLEAHPNCARSKLKSLQNELKEKWDNGELYIGAEPEAYFIENQEQVLNTTGGNDNYFNTKSNKVFLIAEITNTLQEIGFDIERSHTEVGEDQFEINWKFDKAEFTCDKIQLYKLVCQKVANLYDYNVTFLPKPYPNRNGSGMHFHISVVNQKENLFYSEENEKFYNISNDALSFMQGVLNNIRSFAVISNKAEASYPRLIPGFEAPNVIALGAINRSCACRVPIITDPKARKKGLRAEFRFPDPLANPYLLACAFIITGLDGLENKTKFKGFTEENVFDLSYKQLLEKGYKIMPRNLWEAYQEFIGSKILKNKLGESMFESYADLTMEEVDKCQAYANINSVKKHFLG